ncbi:MAG: hypothetical protein ACRD2P_17695 [Terriglobia bacterium]
MSENEPKFINRTGRNLSTHWEDVSGQSAPVFTPMGADSGEVYRDLVPNSWQNLPEREGALRPKPEEEHERK